MNSRSLVNRHADVSFSRYDAKMLSGSALFSSVTWPQSPKPKLSAFSTDVYKEDTAFGA